jgi:hypothetical protein
MVPPVRGKELVDLVDGPGGDALEHMGEPSERVATVWWVPAEAQRSRVVSAHLLSIYDEYISSDRDWSAPGDAADAQRFVAMGNALTAMSIVHGRIAGHVEAGAREVDRASRGAPHRAVEGAAERYARFAGGELEVG